MFEVLQPSPPDKILALMAAFREDERAGKIDLGVGVYKDAQGVTPIMGAVKAAEARLHQAQTTKTYVGPAGDKDFAAAMGDLVLAGAVPSERLRGCQAPGGSGALRVLAELIARAKPGAKVWVSDPTWPNHGPILAACRLEVEVYPYFDPASGGLRFDEMMAALGKANAGDVVLLHGCCHNPTGADLDIDQWGEVAKLFSQRGLVPFVDIAYQGFGGGLDEDAAGVRALAGELPELLIAASCSKNFAVYRERVGAAMIVACDAAQADATFSQMLSIARANYSMPPDHGAALVRDVLADAGLRTEWEAELKATRERMIALRGGLAEALRRQSNSDRFDFLARQRGMFSQLGLTRDEIIRLREEFAIYAVEDSRINIAGLPDDRLDEVAKAICAVIGG